MDTVLRPETMLTYSQIHNFTQYSTGLINLCLCQRGVYQKHQTGLAQFLRHLQRRIRPPTRAVKGLLMVDLRARPLKTRHVTGTNLIHTPVPAPPWRQLLRLNLYIAFIVGVITATFIGTQGVTTPTTSKFWYPQPRKLTTGCPNTFRIGGASLVPLSHHPQLNAANHRLHFRHPPVGTKRIMQPTKTRRVLPLIHRIPALTMVLIRPHLGPQSLVICGHHAALAASGHDLVLAERPTPDMANGAHRAPLITGTMGLGAVLNNV